MTRNRTKVWDLNYVTVIMSETTKSSKLPPVPVELRRPTSFLRALPRRGGMFVRAVVTGYLLSELTL